MSIVRNAVVEFGVKVDIEDNATVVFEHFDESSFAGFGRCFDPSVDLAKSVFFEQVVVEPTCDFHVFDALTDEFLDTVPFEIHFVGFVLLLHLLVEKVDLFRV